MNKLSKNTFTYQGIIKLQLNDSNEVSLMNSGTAHLGNTICKALAGYNISDSVPKFIDFECQNGGKWLSLLNRRIPFTGITYDSFQEIENDLMSRLRLNSVILYEDKKQDSISDNVRLRLAMYDKNNNLLAYATEIDNINNQAGTSTDITTLLEVYNHITPGVDCILKWYMEFYTTYPETINEEQ